MKIPTVFPLSFTISAPIFLAFNNAVKTAADYALQNNLDMTRVRRWLDLSLAMERNYWNSTLLAQAQDKEGKHKEAIKTLEEALRMGKTMERTPFNIQEMEAMLLEWKKK